MPIILCAATPFEIAPTTDWLQREGIADVSVLITGVGLLAATYSITAATLTHKPSFLLQAGIAGGFDPALPLGSVVSIRSEIVGDLGVKENGSFRSLFDMGFADPNNGPWQDGQLVNDASNLARSALPAVDGVTVNEISTDPERIGSWRARGLRAESMEGAALHYVGLLHQIPFLQIRSFSNFAGERDKGKWTIGAAIARLNQELQPLLLNLLNP